MHSFKEFNKKGVSPVFTDTIQECISLNITHLKFAKLKGSLCMFQETLIPVASKSSAFTTDWIIFALVEIIPTQLVGNGYIDLKIKCEKEG